MVRFENMFQIRPVILISFLTLLARNGCCANDAVWEQSIMEDDLDSIHDNENPFAVEEIHDADEFDDDEHIADPEVLKKLDEILAKLFDYDDDGADGELSIEQVSSLIHSARDLFSKLPKNYEVADRFNQRNQIIEDLYILADDLGCSQSELNKRNMIGLSVWDNKRLKPYIKTVDAKQLDECRYRLEKDVLAVAEREKIPNPKEKTHLDELKQEIQIVSSNDHWFEVPADQLDDIATQGVANILKKSSTIDNMQQLKAAKSPEDIDSDMDILIKKNCDHIWGTFYFHYDDAIELDQISRELIDAGQWDFFKPEVRELLEDVSVCTAIRNIQYSSLIA